MWSGYLRLPLETHRLHIDLLPSEQWLDCEEACVDESNRRSVPRREGDVRPVPALALEARGAVEPEDGTFRIHFANSSPAEAVFQVRSGNSAHHPRSYTVEPRKEIMDAWSIAGVGASDYDLSVYGPNGFYRGFRGGISSRHRARLEVQAAYDERNSAVALTIANPFVRFMQVRVSDADRSRARTLVLGPRESVHEAWSLVRPGGWYDLTILVEGDSHFEYRYAGHLGTG
jgi:phospholipase C